MIEYTREQLAAIPCMFPYVAPGCTETYADIVSGPYTRWRVAYLLIGVIGFALSLIRYPTLFVRGSSVQRACFPFLSLAFLTFLVRGIDPNGYQDVLPMVVTEIAGNSASCCVYSVCYMMAVVWGSLLTSYGAHWRMPLGIKLFGSLLILSTWGVFLFAAFRVSREPVQKIDVHKDVGTQFLILVVLGTIGIAYFSYAGVVLHRRLMESFGGSNGETVESEASRATTPTSCPSVSPSVALSVSRDGSLERDYAPGRRKKTALSEREKKKWYSFSLSLIQRWSNLPRITKILLLFSSVCGTVIIVQALRVYSMLHDGFLFGWQQYNLCIVSLLPGEDVGGEEKEKREMEAKQKCHAPFDNEVFTVLQMIVLFLCFWAFWKVPPPQGGDSDEEERDKEREETERTDLKLRSTYSLDLERAGEGKLSETSSYSAALIPPDLRISDSSTSTPGSRGPLRHSIPYQEMPEK